MYKNYIERMGKEKKGKVKKKKKESYIWGTNNSPCPWLHIDIIRIVHSVADSSIPNSFFTSLELF